MENKEIIVKEKLKTKHKVHKVFRNEDFIQSTIINHYKSNIGKEVSNFLNDKRHRSGDEKITYRILNHWEKLGLIDAERDSEKGWRKSSIIDMVWLEIIAALRNFGCSLNLIRKVKKNLELPEWEHNLTQFPVLEVYISLAFVRRIPVYLLVFNNGEAEPVIHTEFLATMDFLKLDDHIRISINDILQRMISIQDLSPIYKTSVELSDEEMDLLF